MTKMQDAKVLVPGFYVGLPKQMQTSTRYQWKYDNVMVNINTIDTIDKGLLNPYNMY